MIELDANVTRFSFHAAQLAPDTFQVVRFKGVEEISHPFRFELELISDEVALPFEDVINQPATFTRMRGDVAVPTSGVVVDFEQAGRTADHVAYRAVLAPRLWRISLSYRNEIYQQMTVEDIIRSVLEENGFTSEDFRFELSAAYPTREYCVQYEETDLAFVSRLMEFEGISYFFEQDGERDVLVLTDDRSTYQPLPDRAALRYKEDAGMVRESVETVDAFTCREQVVTGKVLLKDYNYRSPEMDLRAESQLNAEMPGMRYEYGGPFRNVSEGQRLARVRNEEIECRRRVLRGRSDSAGLRSGYRFTLENHYRDAFNADYLVTKVTHEGTQGAAMGLGVDEDGRPEPSYRNTFTCIPSAVPYRPARTTPVPRLPGLMTAKVESAGGDYAYLDEQGRYRARMHFDLSDRPDGTATQAIRMKQSYSGSGYGLHFPNHAGTEMIWACIGGDVDRPLALGTAPNPSQMSPSVAEKKTQNVIRTWGGNELNLDDAQGQEQFLLKAKKDHTRDVANDESVSVGNNQTVAVASNRALTVGGNDTGTVQGSQSATVSGSSSLTAASRTVKAKGVYALTAGGNITATSSAAVAVHGKGAGVSVQGDAAGVKVKGTGAGVKVTGTGGGVKVTGTGGGVSVKGNGGQGVLLDGTPTFEANGATQAKITAPDVQIGNNTIKVSGNSIVLSAAGSSIKIDASGVTISTGAAITINGSTVKSAAAGAHEITGATVKLNG